MLNSWGLLTACTALVSLAGPAEISISQESYTLPTNGLKVILSPDHTLPLVAVNVWYHAGPINEAKGRSGFAHLFEHLMFQGSKHVGDDQHFKHLGTRGGTEINGTTTFDRTNYIETVPSNELELALWLEADRMGFLLDDLTQNKLDVQREVVMNEKRQSFDNAPYGPSNERTIQLLFGPQHPYYGAIIGSMEDLRAATLDDVRDFFTRYYAPANATLTLVGDFDPKEARALIHTYFASLPPRQRPSDPKVETPAITEPRRAVVKEPVKLAKITMAWLTPKTFAPGDASLGVLADILTGGKSSRLYHRLVYTRPLAQTIEASQESSDLSSMFILEAIAKPQVSIETLEKEIDVALDELRHTPPTEAEVARARNSILTEVVAQMQYVGGFTGRAEMLNRYSRFAGDPDFFSQDLARYRRVTPASVQEAARAYLGAKARVTVVTLPDDRGTDASSQAKGQSDARK